MHAKVYSYLNVEFRKGDIEKKIPVNDGTADLVISNCVINLTMDKVSAFREVYRVLKQGGRMVVSDLVTDAEVAPSSASVEKWCNCLDGALTKKHYLDSIKKAGFQNVKVLSEQLYIDGKQVDGRKITSIVIKAEKLRKNRSSSVFPVTRRNTSSKRGKILSVCMVENASEVERLLKGSSTKNRYLQDIHHAKGNILSRSRVLEKCYYLQ
ncbi:MAG: methyltransferase domain-containing protein [Thermoproteota archaeon]|nr:methyltransferase domain-containing protein [Thermoproteota archaeon]